MQVWVRMWAMVCVVGLCVLCWVGEGRSGPSSRPASRPVGFRATKRVPLWKEGRRLFGKHGCDICHTTDGKACFGGTLKGLFGTVAILEGGRKMRRDSLYFRRKIAHSATLPLADGMNTMPVYKKALSTRDLHALVAFLRRLTPGATTKKTGKAPKKQ